MSWMEELYQVYERHQDRIGYEKTHDAILLPIYHSTANAQVEVTIDAKGISVPQKPWTRRML